MTLNDLEPPK